MAVLALAILITIVLLSCLLVQGLREARRLRSELREALIAEAAHEEYSADLLLWDAELEASA